MYIKTRPHHHHHHRHRYWHQKCADCNYCYDCEDYVGVRPQAPYPYYPWGYPPYPSGPIWYTTTGQQPLNMHIDGQFGKTISCNHSH